MLGPTGLLTIMNPLLLIYYYRSTYRRIDIQEKSIHRLIVARSERRNICTVVQVMISLLYINLKSYRWADRWSLSWFHYLCLDCCNNFVYDNFSFSTALAYMYINCFFVNSYHCKSDCLFKATSKETNTLLTVVRNVPENSSQDLDSLSQSLKLTVPSSVKECRWKGARELTRKARTDVIKNSLILLQASIGRENPSKSEFALCAKNNCTGSWTQGSSSTNSPGGIQRMGKCCFHIQ